MYLGRLKSSRPTDFPLKLYTDLHGLWNQWPEARRNAKAGATSKIVDDSRYLRLVPVVLELHRPEHFLDRRKHWRKLGGAFSRGQEVIVDAEES